MSMTNEDRKMFYVLIKGCSEIYRQDLSSSIIDIFWEILKSYKIESVENAFSKYLKNPKNIFFPKPAQIIEEIEGKKEDKSLQAWSKAFNATLDYGSNYSLVFDDLIIHDVIFDFGGWIKFCEIVYNEKSLPFTQKEFCRRYEGYLDGWSKKDAKVLLGGADRRQIFYNRQHSPESLCRKPISTPIFLGDLKKSTKIFLEIQKMESLKLSRSGRDNELPATLPLVTQ